MMEKSMRNGIHIIFLLALYLWMHKNQYGCETRTAIRG